MEEARIFLKDVQTNAKNKTLKRKTYSKIKNYFEEKQLEYEVIEFFLVGESPIEGLVLLAGKKKGKKFKDSAIQLIKVIYDILNNSVNSDEASDIFSQIDEEILAKLNLGDHYTTALSQKDNYSANVISLAKILLERRPYLDKVAVIGNDTLISKAQVELKEKEEIQKRKETIEKQKAALEMAKIVVEPRTWDAAKKQGTKLLSLDSLVGAGSNAFDTVKMRTEIMENFINPMTGEAITFDSSIDYKTLHYCYEEFNVKTFIEELYGNASISKLRNDLDNFEQRKTVFQEESTELIDKNIYQYFDCKEVLDGIFKQFKKSSLGKMEDYLRNVEDIKNKLEKSVGPVKDSFAQMVKMNRAKEIISKFGKLFEMKEEISRHLKFGNYAELIRAIGLSEKMVNKSEGNRFVYKDFIHFFEAKVEETKQSLLRELELTPEKKELIQYFEFLLEFTIETEVLDKILCMFKERISDKIDGFFKKEDIYLEESMKSFFRAEYGQLDNVSISVAEAAHVEESKDLSKISRSLFFEMKEYVELVNSLEEIVAMKLSHLTTKRTVSYEKMTNEIFFKLVSLMEENIFVENRIDSLLEEFSAKMDVKLNFNLDFELFSGDKTLFSNKFERTNLTEIPNNLMKIYKLFEKTVSEEGQSICEELKISIFENLYAAYIYDFLEVNVAFLKKTHLFDFNETFFTIENRTALLINREIFNNVYKQCKAILNLHTLNAKNEIKCDKSLLVNALVVFFQCFTFNYLELFETEQLLNKNDYEMLTLLLIDFGENCRYLKEEATILFESLFGPGNSDVQRVIKFVEIVESKLDEKLQEAVIKDVSSIFVSRQSVYASYTRDLEVRPDFSDGGVYALKQTAVKIGVLEEIKGREFCQNLVANVLLDLARVVKEDIKEVKVLDFVLFFESTKKYLTKTDRSLIEEEMENEIRQYWKDERQNSLKELQDSYSKFIGIFSE